MCNTLYPGDHVFCFQRAYRLITKGNQTVTVRGPKPGALVLFTPPGSTGQKTVKRCVAVSGQTIQITNKRVLVNEAIVAFPGTAIPSSSEMVPGSLVSRDEMAQLRLPGRGDTVRFSGLAAFQMDYMLLLIRQENPDADISVRATLLIDGEEQNDTGLKGYLLGEGKFSMLNHDSLSWTDYKRIIMFLKRDFPQRMVHVERQLYVNGNPLLQYLVKGDCFFAMSDFWDRFSDSRSYGFISVRSAVARPTLVYFSVDPEKKWFQLLSKIRWKRIGRFIQ
jgi:hypothetical protein